MEALPRPPTPPLPSRTRSPWWRRMAPRSRSSTRATSTPSASSARRTSTSRAYSVGPSTPDFIKSLGKDANFVYDGSQWTPQVKYEPAFYLSVADYVAAYKAKYPDQGDPDYHVAESTAACLALQRAIENAKSLDPKKVRDALVALDVTTFYGQIKFDSRGINIYKPMVVEP